MGPEYLGVELAQSWAEGLAAVGTVAAFFVAAVVYARSESDRRDAEANQARLVYCSLEGDEVHPVLRVQNASNAPVHNLNGVVKDVYFSESEAFEVGGSIDWIYTLGPQEQRVVWLPEEEQGIPDRLMGAEGHPPIRAIQAWIQFEDATGQKWERALQDQPRRIKSKRLRWAITSSWLWLQSRTATLRKYRRQR